MARHGDAGMVLKSLLMVGIAFAAVMLVLMRPRAGPAPILLPTDRPVAWNEELGTARSLEHFRTLIEAPRSRERTRYGHVMTVDDRPVNGADIVVRSPVNAFQAQTRSDQHGSYSIEIPADRFELSADAPGYARAHCMFERPVAGALPNIVLRQEGQIEGFVLDSQGLVVVDSSVILRLYGHFDTGEFHVEQKVGLDGSFGFGELPIGAIGEITANGGKLQAPRRPIQVLPGTHRVFLTLIPLCALLGRIEDAAGRDVPGCRLEVYPMSAGTGDVRQVARATTRPNGKFVVTGLFPGNYLVVMKNNPWWEIHSLDVVLHVPENVTQIEHTLRLANAVVLAGTVSSLDGECLPGIRVDLCLGEYVVETRMTDTRGAYTFVAPAQEGSELRIEVAADLDDGFVHRSESIDGAQAGMINFLLPRVERGTLTLVCGMVGPGASLRIGRTGETPSQSSSRVKTIAAQARSGVLLEEGDYEVELASHCPLESPQKKLFTIRAREESTVYFDADAFNAARPGIVRELGTGRVLPEVEIWLSDWRGGLIERVESDAEGCFALTHAGEGGRLQSRKNGFVQSEGAIVAPGQGLVTVGMSQSASLVVHTDGGARERVVLTPAGAPPSSPYGWLPTPNGLGEWRFPRIPEGAHTLHMNGDMIHVLVDSASEEIDVRGLTGESWKCNVLCPDGTLCTEWTDVQVVSQTRDTVSVGQNVAPGVFALPDCAAPGDLLIGALGAYRTVMAQIVTKTNGLGYAEMCGGSLRVRNVGADAKAGGLFCLRAESWEADEFFDGGLFVGNLLVPAAEERFVTGLAEGSYVFVREGGEEPRPLEVTSGESVLVLE